MRWSSRPRRRAPRGWAAHALHAFALPVALLIALALVVGLISGDSGEVPGTVALVGAAASRIPSVAVMVAVALLAAAAMPSHARAIGWGALVVAFGLGELGTLVGLPTWLADVSPFAHVSALPAGEFEAAPAVVLTAVAAGLTGLAFGAYRRRDVV